MELWLPFHYGRLRFLRSWFCVSPLPFFCGCGVGGATLAGFFALPVALTTYDSLPSSDLKRRSAAD